MSCHGVRGIRGPREPSSKVHPQAIPETCGHCHADPAYCGLQEGRWPSAAHQPVGGLQEVRSWEGASGEGRPLLALPPVTVAMATTAAMPPRQWARSQVCRTCHAMNGTLFDGSKHKQAFEQHRWPECKKCHGKHEILKPTDALVSDAPTASAAPATPSTPRRTMNATRPRAISEHASTWSCRSSSSGRRRSTWRSAA